MRDATGWLAGRGRERHWLATVVMIDTETHSQYDCGSYSPSHLVSIHQFTFFARIDSFFETDSQGCWDARGLIEMAEPESSQEPMPKDDPPSAAGAAGQARRPPRNLDSTAILKGDSEITISHN